MDEGTLAPSSHALASPKTTKRKVIQGERNGRRERERKDETLDDEGEHQREMKGDERVKA